MSIFVMIHHKGMNSTKIVECLQKPYLPVSPINNNHTDWNLGIYKATNQNVENHLQNTASAAVKVKSAVWATALSCMKYSHTVSSIPSRTVMIECNGQHLQFPQNQSHCDFTHTPELLSRSSTERHEPHDTKISVTLVSVILAVHIHI